MPETASGPPARTARSSSSCEPARVKSRSSYDYGEMTVPDVRLVGSAPNGRRLYVGAPSGLDDWPSELGEPFVAFTALDVRERTGREIEALARTLLDHGCVYACAWGPDAGRVELAFDLLALEAEEAGRPYIEGADAVVMTTAHEAEPLDEALWFAVFAAMPADLEANVLVAIAEDRWRSEIEARLADADRLNADVLASDEDTS
jgi:hypothetical protein